MTGSVNVTSTGKEKRMQKKARINKTVVMRKNRRTTKYPKSSGSKRIASMRKYSHISELTY